jgi:hypothetical protein
LPTPGFFWRYYIWRTQGVRDVIQDRNAEQRLYDILVPRDGVLAVLCEAYFDESVSHGSKRIVTVAGYLFKKRQAELFSRKARRFLRKKGMPFFHQTDCAVGGKYYKDMDTNERRECQDFLIENIHLRALYGFSTSVNADDYEKIVGIGNNIPTPYAFALTGCFNAVRNWTKLNKFKGKIAYFIEQGCEHERDARRFLSDYILAGEQNKQFYFHGSDTFADKRCVMPLAAADMLAWYTNQEFTRLEKGLQTRRKDFDALLRFQDRRIDHSPTSLREFRELLDKYEGFNPTRIE